MVFFLPGMLPNQQMICFGMGQGFKRSNSRRKRKRQKELKKSRDGAPEASSQAAQVGQRLSSGVHGGSDKRSEIGVFIFPIGIYASLNGEPATELQIEFPNHLIVEHCRNVGPPR